MELDILRIITTDGDKVREVWNWILGENRFSNDLYGIVGINAMHAGGTYTFINSTSEGIDKLVKICEDSGQLIVSAVEDTNFEAIDVAYDKLLEKINKLSFPVMEIVELYSESGKYKCTLYQMNGGDDAVEDAVQMLTYKNEDSKEYCL